MENLSKELRECYNYTITRFSPNDKIEGAVISELDIVKAHFLVADYFREEDESVLFGIKNFDLLSSAVSRQVTGFGDAMKWNDDFHKMATLFYGLTKNHAFEDGNKRTALLSLLLYMDRLGLMLSHKKEKLEQLAVRIAANQLTDYGRYVKYQNEEDAEVRFIADYIKGIMRKKKRITRTMTYAELNYYVKEFGVYLDNADKGFINIYQKKSEIVHFFIWGKKQVSKTVRIMQVAFPGWKRQVPHDTLKTVLRKAGLTLENGFDEEVLLKKAEPLYVLINEFRDPLQRLKDQ